MPICTENNTLISINENVYKDTELVLSYKYERTYNDELLFTANRFEKRQKIFGWFILHLPSSQGGSVPCTLGSGGLEKSKIHLWQP